MPLSATELRQYVIHFSDSFNVKPELVAALIMTESEGDQYAIRYEPKWKYMFDIKYFAAKVCSSIATERVGQSTSWGLMQIMGSVARELGFVEDFPALCEPGLNLYYGCKKVSELHSKYDSLEDVIAAYNAGEPKKMGDGKYINQPYVDRVLKFVNVFRKTGILFEGG